MFIRRWVGRNGLSHYGCGGNGLVGLRGEMGWLRYGADGFGLVGKLFRIVGFGLGGGVRGLCG